MTACPNPCPCPVHAAKQRRDAKRNHKADKRKRDRAAYMREYRKRRKRDQASG